MCSAATAINWLFGAWIAVILLMTGVILWGTIRIEIIETRRMRYERERDRLNASYRNDHGVY